MAKSAEGLKFAGMTAMRKIPDLAERSLKDVLGFDKNPDKKLSANFIPFVHLTRPASHKGDKIYIPSPSLRGSGSGVG